MPSFKIRRADGARSRGGIWPSWSKEGKSWRSESALRIHLTNVNQQWIDRVRRNRRGPDALQAETPPHPYRNAVIERYEVVSESAVDIASFVDKELDEINEKLEIDKARGHKSSRWDVHRQESLIEAKGTLT